MRILLVEDDALLGKGTKTGLEQRGYAVDWVRDGESANTVSMTHDYAAVLLDLGLPKHDGMSVLRSMRKRGYANAILIITARDAIPDRVLGLDAGADDFIVKPFNLDELAARMRAGIRRSNGRIHGKIRHGALTVEPATSLVTLRGEAVDLTPRELALLLNLLEHRGRTLSRSQLEEALYAWGAEVESNAVEVHIHHLRRKLGRGLIKTVHGVGYCIENRAGDG